MTLPITHLSVSSLKEFLACPRKFRLHRIDGIAPAYRPAALAFGCAFHETVAFDLHKHACGEPANDEATTEHFRDGLKKHLHDGDVPVLYDDEEDEQSLGTKGAQMVRAFWKEMPLPDQVLAIEQRFRLSLFDPETGEELPPLVGSIDAAVVALGKPVVWELKTARQRWPEEKVLYDFQPTAYGMAFRAEHGIDPELQLAVVTKAREPAVQLVHLRRTRQDEAELVATAASVCRAIEAGVDHPQRSWACKGCEYAGACR